MALFWLFSYLGTCEFHQNKYLHSRENSDTKTGDKRQPRRPQISFAIVRRGVVEVAKRLERGDRHGGSSLD